MLNQHTSCEAGLRVGSFSADSFLLGPDVVCAQKEMEDLLDCASDSMTPAMGRLGRGGRAQIAENRYR